jgi:hypothetical protein
VSAASLARTLDAVAALPRTGTLDATKVVERIAREVGASVGPVALGKKGRRTKLSAVSRIRGSGNAIEATVWGKPTGPWVWVTSGTKPHTIPKARGRGRGKARTTRYLKGAGYEHPIGVPVHHPGAGGKGAWRRVEQRARIEVPKAFLDAARRVIANG